MTENLVNVSNAKTICAIGTGKMGVGTALSSAKAGFNVVLCGRKDANIASALQTIEQDLATLQKYNLLQESIPEIMARIQTRKITLDSDIKGEILDPIKLKAAIANADFVFESISEELYDKQVLFFLLDHFCPKHTIFTTNTSALSPTQIAEILSPERQENFVVTHGFRPFHLIPFVEVVPGQRTSSATMKAAIDFMKEIGQKPVGLTKESPGFIVNYIQAAIIWSALDVFVSGTDAETVDNAFRQHLGHRYVTQGPLEMAHMGHITPLLAEDMLIEKPARLKWSATAPVSDSDIAKHIHDAALSAALELVVNGVASAQDIDAAFKDSLGRRYSVTPPLISADMGGLDIFKSIFKTVGYLNQPSAVAEFMEKAVREDRLGAGKGIGIYQWSDKGAEMGALRAKELIRRLVQDMEMASGTNTVSSPVRESVASEYPVGGKLIPQPL